MSGNFSIFCFTVIYDRGNFMHLSVTDLAFYLILEQFPKSTSASFSLIIVFTECSRRHYRSIRKPIIDLIDLVYKVLLSCYFYCAYCHVGAGGVISSLPLPFGVAVRAPLHHPKTLSRRPFDYYLHSFKSPDFVHSAESLYT